MKAQNILALALSGLLVANLTSCDDKAAAGAQQMAMPPAKVATMKLQQRDVAIESTWFGHLRGVEQADIKPEVTGKLLKQSYWDGSPCEKGEVLFEIDPSSYKAALNQAEASLAAAKAGVLQAEVADERAGKDVERYAKLVESGSVSEKTYSDAVHAKKETAAAMAAAQAQVKQAEAALENAKINLDRCTIRAPFKGMASKANVSVGDLITAGTVTLTSMSSIDPIRVDFAVPGKHMISKIVDPSFDPAKGMVSPINDFEVILEDGSVFDQRGIVVAVDSEVNSTTGTVNFVGRIPNPQLKLRTGSAVRVRAKTDEIKDAFLVPSRAVLSAMNHRYIYVADPNNEPQGIDVQLGPEVTLDMPNGDGTTCPMLMQVVTGSVKPLAESMKEIGYENPTDAPVIVKGSQKAQMLVRQNMMVRAGMAPGQGIAKVAQEPYVYAQPESTTPSVTAQKK